MLTKNPFYLGTKPSSFWAVKNGKLVNIIDGRSAPPRFLNIHSLLKGMFHPGYVCIGAYTVFSKNLERLILIDGKMSTADINLIAHHTFEYIKEYKEGGEGSDLTLLIAFTENETYNQVEFRKNLWNFFAKLSVEQAKFFPWAKSSTSMTDDPTFSLSFAEESLFAAAFHNASPRTSRRFPYPVIVINPHAQFQNLKNKGVFVKWKEIIRKRDKETDGVYNPTLSDYGDQSEWITYDSATILGKCPYADLIQLNSKCPFTRIVKFFKTALFKILNKKRSQTITH